MDQADYQQAHNCASAFLVDQERALLAQQGYGPDIGSSVGDFNLASFDCADVVQPAVEHSGDLSLFHKYFVQTIVPSVQPQSGTLQANPRNDRNLFPAFGQASVSSATRLAGRVEYSHATPLANEALPPQPPDANLALNDPSVRDLEQHPRISLLQRKFPLVSSRGVKEVYAGFGPAVQALSSNRLPRCPRCRGQRKKVRLFT